MIVVGPLKFGLGVKVIVPSGLIVTVPFGELALVTVIKSPSGSLSFAKTAMLTGVSSLVDAMSFAATGGGLVTVQLNVELAVPPLPSLTVTVTE